MVMVLAPSTTRCASRFSPGRAGHAREIHAPVLLEMLILGGENGVLQDLRELFVGEQHAALQGEVADHLAVIGIKFGDDVGLKIFEGVNLRADRWNKQTAGPPAAPTAIEPSSSSDEGDAPDNLAAAQAQRDRRQLYHGSIILTQIAG